MNDGIEVSKNYNFSSITKLLLNSTMAVCTAMVLPLLCLNFKSTPSFAFYDLLSRVCLSEGQPKVKIHYKGALFDRTYG